MTTPRGVLTALLTPTDKAGEIQLDAIDALVDFQVDKGVDGLFVLGTAGGGPLLSLDERRRLAERIIDAAAGRIAVVVHVGAMPTDVAVDLANHAVRAGADAIASVPPVYYAPDPATVTEYYQELRAAVGPDTELLAYNNPSATAFELRPDHADELHEEGIINGVKQAWTSMADLARLLSRGVPVWMANAGCNLAAISMGARGAISTLTNVAPELFVGLRDAWETGDLERARRMQFEINEVSSRLRVPIIGALHGAATERGLPAGEPRRPLRLPQGEEVPRVLGALDFLDRQDTP